MRFFPFLALAALASAGGHAGEAHVVANTRRTDPVNFTHAGSGGSRPGTGRRRGRRDSNAGRRKVPTWKSSKPRALRARRAAKRGRR